MRYVPRHVKGIPPGVREAARNAAPRSRLSVSSWLNSLIVDAAAAGGLASRDAIAALSREFRALSDRIDCGLATIRQQVAAGAADAISGPAESIRRDVASLKEIQTTVDRRTQDTFEAVYGTIEQVVDRLAAIENELRDRHLATSAAGERESRGGPTAARDSREGAEPAPIAETRALARPAADDKASTPPALDGQGWAAARPSDILRADLAASAARLRCPAVPDFAPNGSIAPVPGTRRTRVVADAIDRIAASLDASGGAKLAEASAPARTNFVSAARRAAGTVVSEYKGAATYRLEKPGRNAGRNLPRGMLLERLGPRAKSVLFGAGIVLLTCSVLSLPHDFFFFGAPAVQESARPVTPIDETASRRVRSEPAPSTDQGANLESPTSADLRPDEGTSGQAPRWPVPADMTAPPTIQASVIQAPAAPLTYPPRQAGEGTAGAASSPTRNMLPPTTAGRNPATPDLTATPLPPTIGGKALLAAAAAGDPGACYEIATRFAEGRNTTRDLAMAAAWLDRAARSGLAAAQFRLGNMYEKGLGVTKDLAEARRLYVAAAGRGHAKAMHNLAVLYATGLDGKPDYAVASQWFRKAAAYGIVDSQYNLAILYARGAGIEHNFAESYKWFALAAKSGDKDAARKRDEVAMRLDAKQLESAKLNAESFVAVPQPEEATAVNAPVGGWDQVAAAATTKSKAFVRSERFPR